MRRVPTLVALVAALAVASHPSSATPRQIPAHSSSYLGVRIPLSQAPWVISTTVLDEHYRHAKLPRGHELNCSGAVVGPRLVVTAEHCIDGLDMSHRGVHVGADNLLLAQGRFVPIAHIWTQRIGSRTLRHDVATDTALIETTKPLGVPALPIATTPVQPGDAVTVFGFGSDGRSPSVDKVDHPFLQRLDSIVTPACPLTNDDDEAICAAGTNGGGARPGDSGGPLVAWRNGTPELVGDVSRGDDSSLSTTIFADVVAQRAFLEAPPKRDEVPLGTRPIAISGDLRPGGTVSCKAAFSPKPTGVDYTWTIGARGGQGVYYDAHGRRLHYFSTLPAASDRRRFKIPRSAGGKRLQCILDVQAGPWFGFRAVAVARVPRHS